MNCVDDQKINDIVVIIVITYLLIASREYRVE